MAITSRIAGIAETVTYTEYMILTDDTSDVREAVDQLLKIASPRGQRCDAS